MVFLTELLPGSSSSSPTHDHRYDVFLSFRGADTRNSFTDHLYNALLDADINTFLDDEEIETGEQLKPELESAIKSSRASVIVLSRNYASSTWCLDELVLILEQKTNFNQIVIPIFYHVEPTHVRKQENSFGEAMAKHKQRMEAETDAEKRSQLAQKMELWKMALTQVAGLKGQDAKDRKETEFIEDIVTDLHSRLGIPLNSSPPLLIGRSHYIKIISSWLTDGSCHATDILTIVGMGGIGKTSLAKYVFQIHSRKFDRSSFVEGINTRCNEHYNGLLDLQKQLHGDISKNTKLKVNDVSVYVSKIENALAHKRVFIVLDDIGSLDQLDALLGNKGLHPRSKIIVTTMDASLTERCTLFKSQVHSNHKEVILNGLYLTESLELLCIHAFNRQKPIDGFKEVSEKLVKYCDGHPLALEVLGKSLYKRDVAYWEDCIKGLKQETHSCIKKALHISFDSLSLNDKVLFKHIACFFVGTNRDLTEAILNACDINTRFGITNLIDKCLLSIRLNQLMMHQLVQELGRDLVRQESPDMPWERSRLWCNEESFKGTKNILGFALDMRMLEKVKSSGSIQLKTDALSKMDNLKLLQLNYVKISGSYKNISKELRWLCMQGFHLKSIPSELPMENLVALDMSHSNIESFDMSYSSSQRFVSKLKGLIGSSSKDKRLLGSLKILDLSFCEQLCSLGGFFELPALERLVVRKCISLIEVCESVEQCVGLVHIDLSCCYKLKKVPISMGNLKKVKTLMLDGCSSSESQINTSDLKFFTTFLPSSLVCLSLSDCNLHNESFPKDWSCMSMLKHLYLDSNPIVSMPYCVRTLPKLEELYLDHCKKMISIEHPPCTLKLLSIESKYSHSRGDYKSSLRKIKFDPEMSPLEFTGYGELSSNSSCENDGMVKIQTMTGVEQKVLHSLGWTNLEFIKERSLRIRTLGRKSIECQTQMYYEFGIFSTIYEGEEMPNWIECRSDGPSISFTIPSSPSKLRGLNFCYTMETYPYNKLWLPMIKVCNLTKNHSWVYNHYANGAALSGRCISLLSHWMFGPNEMEGGDHITISVAKKPLTDTSLCYEQVTKNCGVRLVYDDYGKIKEEEEEDALGSYKSWNHIIGGDLLPFQLKTGEYFLNFEDFSRFVSQPHGDYRPFIDYKVGFKEQRVMFKAFSGKKYGDASQLKKRRKKSSNNSSEDNVKS